jgi:hypothetical protein
LWGSIQGRLSGREATGSVPSSSRDEGPKYRGPDETGSIVIPGKPRGACVPRGSVRRPGAHRGTPDRRLPGAPTAGRPA